MYKIIQISIFGELSVNIFPNMTTLSEISPNGYSSSSPLQVLGLIRVPEPISCSVSYTHLDVYKRQVLQRIDKQTEDQKERNNCGNPCD